MTFFTPLPPLINRALTPEGLTILKAMRSAAITFSATNLQAIERRTGLTKNEVWRSVQTMENAGLVETPDIVRKVFSLTDTGWAAAGGKPYWMEEG
ncbi:winged helix-turn-helix domain-containing protein [Yoonia sp. R2331]|uniref:winged helix-turn-helix domain-containing protein n=1 Tax=Yoonia sp. R2331 TaxID=3237238 RepID=UPI0034E3EE69